MQRKFDMFILDLMLLGTDGFEICKKIREKIEMNTNKPQYIETI